MKTKKNAESVGAAVIGLGRGKALVRALDKAVGAELLAVCDINKDLVEEIAEEYETAAYTDYREMIERDDIGLVCVCTPSGMHMEMAMDCAREGKHVLSEKPLDIDLDIIDRALKLFEEKKLTLGCIFQNRFLNINRKKKEIAGSGKLGRLIFANAHIKWYRAQEYYERNGGWRGTWEQDGGGSLMNQSVHTIDLMQWIMGPVSSVVGQTRIWSHDIETEDMGVALVKFKSGALGTIVGSTATYPGFGTTLDIHGVNGGICNNILKYKNESGEDEEIPLADLEMEEAGASDPEAIGSDTTYFQVQDMVDAVREGRDHLLSGREARNAVEIILAVYESARRGKEVFLPL